MLDEAKESSPKDQGDTDDNVPALPGPEAAVARPGDMWLLGRHRLVCGDARRAEAYSSLMQGERADLIFADPPYNVRIDGHVCGLGRIRHR